MRVEPSPRRFALRERLAVAALLSLAAGAGGCLPVSINQCSKDSDCPKVAGKSLTCTKDNLCVVGTAAELLCQETFPAQPPPGAIPIGVLQQAPTDTLSKLSIQLALDGVNPPNGPRPFVLHYCDTSRNDDDALKAAQILLKERKVVALVGPSFSREVLAVAQEVGAAQVPLISHSATAPGISNLPQKGFIFRVVQSDLVQGRVLANEVKALPNPPVSALIINVDDAYGNGLADAFRGSVGADVTVNQVRFKEGDSAAIRAHAQKAIAEKPRAVLAIATQDAPQLLTELAGLVSTSMIYTADGAKNGEVLALLDQTPMIPIAHFGRIRGTAPSVDESNVTFKSFKDAMQSRFGMDPNADAFSAYSYDALFAAIIAASTVQGGTPSGSLVSQALRRIKRGGADINVGGTALLQAVEKLSSGTVTLLGTTGAITFADNGDRESGIFEVWKINPASKSFIKEKTVSGQ